MVVMLYTKVFNVNLYFQEHALLALKANDIEQFSIALTKLATPLNVEQRKKIKSATKAKRGPHSDSFDTPTDNDLEKTFPLPPEHEINQPFDENSHPDEGKIRVIEYLLIELLSTSLCIFR